MCWKANKPSINLSIFLSIYLPIYLSLYIFFYRVWLHILSFHLNVPLMICSIRSTSVQGCRGRGSVKVWRPRAVLLRAAADVSDDRRDISVAKSSSWWGEKKRLSKVDGRISAAESLCASIEVKPGPLQWWNKYLSIAVILIASNQFRSRCYWCSTIIQSKGSTVVLPVRT